jgi:hypothetical protein
MPMPSYYPIKNFFMSFSGPIFGFLSSKLLLKLLNKISPNYRAIHSFSNYQSNINLWENLCPSAPNDGENALKDFLISESTFKKLSIYFRITKWLGSLPITWLYLNSN